MSFSTEIKNELSRLDSTKTEYIAELSAIVRNSAEIDNTIKISIENNAVARRIFRLFKNSYDITPIVSVRKRYNFEKKLNYTLEIKEKSHEILTDLSIIDDKDNYLSIPKEYIISDEEEVRAYLRGLFLSVGSTNNPKTSRYHLEFIINDKTYGKFIIEMLNNYNLNAKILKRKKNYMIYVKEAEKISDFLRIIKAYNGVMFYEDIRIYRDHKNMTNRLNNCEQANIDKVFLTSNNQIKDIEFLESLDLIDTLDDKLKKIILYRKKYPESSLQELSEIISLEEGQKITKSGLNHRFRKLKQVISDIKKQKK